VRLWRLYALVSLGGVVLAVILLIIQLLAGDDVGAGGWFYFLFYWVGLSAVVGLISLSAVGARWTLRRFVTGPPSPPDGKA
jgi:hypothetical protein